MAPGGWKSVKVPEIDWLAVKEIARRDYGMEIGAFLGLLVRNWLRKGWKLELDR